MNLSSTSDRLIISTLLSIGGTERQTVECKLIKIVTCS